jgi:hypothetical protein
MCTHLLSNFIFKTAFRNLFYFNLKLILNFLSLCNSFDATCLLCNSSDVRINQLLFISYDYLLICSSFVCKFIYGTVFIHLWLFSFATHFLFLMLSLKLKIDKQEKKLIFISFDYFLICFSFEYILYLVNFIKFKLFNVAKYYICTLCSALLAQKV